MPVNEIEYASNVLQSDSVKRMPHTSNDEMQDVYLKRRDEIKENMQLRNKTYHQNIQKYKDNIKICQQKLDEYKSEHPIKSFLAYLLSIFGVDIDAEYTELSNELDKAKTNYYEYQKSYI